MNDMQKHLLDTLCRGNSLSEKEVFSLFSQIIAGEIGEI